MLSLVTHIVSDTFPAECSLPDVLGLTRPPASVPWLQVGSAFTSKKSREELETIASKPSRDHVFQVTNFEALKTIQNQLQEKIFAIEGELRFRDSGTASEAALCPETHIPLQKLDPPNLWHPDPQHELAPASSIFSNSGSTWSVPLE